MAKIPPITVDNTLQYLRDIELIAFGKNQEGVDLSQLRIKFSVKRSDTATPNTADIRVYNLGEATALKIGSRKEFNRVILQAGYPGNRGVIFQGNIKQTIIGRESATDTFIDIIAGDGDRAYNFTIVNTTLSKGSTQMDQVNTIINAMSVKGVTAGSLAGLTQSSVLPRGKVLFSNARNYLRTIAQTQQNSWSIQNEKVNFIAKKAYLPGTSIKITQTTGMVGTPEQTTEGVNVKCLLNPNIQIGGRVYLDNSSILQQKLNLEQIAALKGNVSAINAQFPNRLNSDGSYYVLVLEHIGDTRGIEWYTKLVCLNQDVSANPLNSVQPGTGNKVISGAING